MLLKDLLKEVFNKASLENDILIKENIIDKWVHRFGLDSLNDLLTQNLVLIEEDNGKENEEQISLIDEDSGEENENTSENTKINTKSNNYIRSRDLPLPHINNLRKWINKDKKAS